jgi:hypothetical protein
MVTRTGVAAGLLQAQALAALLPAIHAWFSACAPS